MIKRNKIIMYTLFLIIGLVGFMSDVDSVLHTIGTVLVIVISVLLLYRTIMFRE